MDKIEFMNRLKKGLDDFPREEQENALKYYVEYFQEAGDDKEEEVMKELGDPDTIVAEIRKNYDGKLEKNGKSNGKRVEPWVIILLIFASPFLFTGVILVFSLLLVVWAVILSFGIVAVASAVCGVILTLFSFFVIPSSVSTFIFMLGTGIMMAAIGVFFGEFTWYCSKKLVEGINFLVTKFLKRGELNA